MNDRILWLGLLGICLSLLIVFFPGTVHAIFFPSPSYPQQENVLTWLGSFTEMVAIWIGGLIMFGISTIMAVAAVAHRAGKESARRRYDNAHLYDQWD